MRRSIAELDDVQAGAGTVSENDSDLRHEGGGEANQTAVERPVGIVEIAGFVKWFDVAKGYGFVVPDGGKPDGGVPVKALSPGLRASA